MSGRDLVREGAAMVAVLFPNAADRPAARKRLRKRYRALLDSGNPSLQDIGFFLLGLAEAMKGKRNA